MTLKIKVGQAVGPTWVIDKKHYFDFLIHNLRSAWLTKVSIPFLNSLHNLLYDAFIIFQQIVKNFEIAHKTC